MLNGDGRLIALFAVRSPDEAPLKVNYCPMIPVDALSRHGDTAALWVLPKIEPAPNANPAASPASQQAKDGR